MSKKDAYYFSHDANAQDDPKCMKLIEEMGMEGYGIFWALVEKLRSERNYTLPMTVINAFALRWHTTPEKVEKVVKGYKLFRIKKIVFYSDRLKSTMTQRSELAKRSAAARWSDADALRSDSGGNANGMRRDANKVKESKVKINTGISDKKDTPENPTGWKPGDYEDWGDQGILPG